ncbi:MAG: hypothetical protein GYA23_08755 [Methanomicrobiales archaeon]|nr:hypothetical protein [Methanomicrobiales archaeon]
MADGDLFSPNGTKLLLAGTLVIPFWFVLLIVTGLMIDMTILLVITLIISYVAGCVLDAAIESQTAKIAIASVAALISIVLGYLVYQSMTMICDPVHDPGGTICDPVHVPETPTGAPTVIETVQPTPTEMIYDPVHQPNTCGPACGVAAGTTTSVIAEKLDECRRKCDREPGCP